MVSKALQRVAYLAKCWRRFEAGANHKVGTRSEETHVPRVVREEVNDILIRNAISAKNYSRTREHGPVCRDIPSVMPEVFKIITSEYRALNCAARTVQLRNKRFSVLQLLYTPAEVRSLK